MNIDTLFSLTALLKLTSSGVIGAALGWLHFRTLRWNTHLYLKGGMTHALALHAARTCGMAITLYGCARLGIALPALLLGVLLARQAVLRRTR